MPAPTIAVPVEGRIRVRVRYCECDPMGVAHHSAYIAWLEMGRTELLREAEVSYADMEAAGILLPVTKIEIRYRAPVRYDEVVEIETRVVGGGRARIDHAYVVRNSEGRSPVGMVVAEGSSTLGCVGRDGRPRPLPEWLAQRPAKRAKAGRRD